jgi:hypothetical protein
MGEKFDCLVDGSHDFRLKCKKGNVCANCGVVSLPCSHLSYKSSRYSYKVHFSLNDYEVAMTEDDQLQRLTNQAYIGVREDLIKFILDKGRQLKMSLKTLHLAVYIMDAFCEKHKTVLKSHDHKVVAASTLLIASKSGELDERIPFISKLKKYTGLYNDVNEFKKLEVMIAETLDWDIQKVTFYSYVEYYLTAGVLTPQDKVSKRIVDYILEKGVEDTVRLLAREENLRPKQALESLIVRGATSSIKDATDPTTKEEYVPMHSLTFEVRNEIVKVFELYIRDLSNLLLREFNYWGHSKNIIATSLLLYTRGSILEGGSVWSSRIKDLTGLATIDVRDAFSKVTDFLMKGGAKPHPKVSPKKVSPIKSSTTLTHNIYTPSHGPLTEVSSNYESVGYAPKYTSYGLKSVRDPSKEAPGIQNKPLETKNRFSCFTSRQPTSKEN